MAKSAKSAEILIYGDIGSSYWGDGVSASDFAALLKEVGAVEELDVRINSYGGDVADGVTIYQLLNEHKARVTIHVDGIAASAASFIAMAGDKIIVSEAGRMMIHDALTIAIGNAADFREVAEHLENTSEQIAEVYSARSGKTITEIRDAMRAETWFTGKEAVEFGLAHEVAPLKKSESNDENKVVALDTSKHKFRNAPAELLPGRAAIAAQVARQQVALTLSRAAASATKR